MPDTTPTSRTMLRWISGSAIALLMSASLCGPVAAEIIVAPSGKGYDIDITEQASSTEVVDAIADAIGVTVEGYPEEGPIAASHLRSASLERALRALLPKAAFVVRFNEDDTPAAIIFLSAPKDASPDGGEPGIDEGMDENDDAAAPTEELQ